MMAPVAVATDYHGRGVGQALINHGLTELKESGVSIVVTYGDINFYSKTGFEPISEALIRAPLALSYPEGWLAQSLDGHEISPIEGKPVCLEPINHRDYW
ncbi:MAG: GNAT family N-acetyltransferase [Saccharospirillum sp.]